MTIKLLHSTPLWVASTAIRKCWASEAKSDSENIGLVKSLTVKSFSDAGDYIIKADMSRTEEKDKELIERIGNKNKHASTLEHLNYSYDIDGISRACLQEVARHRHASISVKSTRYTLKELKDEPIFQTYSGNNYGVSREEEYKRVSKYVINPTNFNDYLDDMAEALNNVIGWLNDNEAGLSSNDKVKYMLPEAYKTSLVWTVNARSLQNFLALRTSPSALWEIRDLAKELYDKLPEEHKYLFKDSIYAPTEAT